MPVWWGSQHAGTSVWVNRSGGANNGPGLACPAAPNSLVFPAIIELEVFQREGGMDGRGRARQDELKG